MKKDYMKELLKLRREKKLAETKQKVKEQAEYCNAIGVLLSSHGDFEGALVEHQEELALCQAQADELGEAVAHRKLGEALCELGRVQEALVHHTRFLEAARRQQSRLEMQRATATVGRTYLLLAEIESSNSKLKVSSLEKAQKWFEKSLKIVPSVPDLSEKERAEMEARLHINLGIVADTADRAADARQAYMKAASVTEQHHLLDDGRRVHDLLALNLQAAGQHRDALRHLETALRLAGRLHDSSARADSLHTRAQVLLQLGDPEGAGRAWYKAYKLHSANPDDHEKHARCLRYVLQIARAEDRLALLAADDHQGRCRRHERLADRYCQLAAYRPALDHYTQQLSCADALGRSEVEKAAIFASIAATQKDMRNFADAIHWYRRELAARHGNPTEMYETLMNLADLETSSGGGVSSVCELYRQAADVAAEAGLARRRAFALRDMALTYAEHGMTDHEERVRRDLQLAVRCDGLPDNWEDDDQSSGAASGQQANYADEEQQSDTDSEEEEIDIDNLSDMSSDADEEGVQERPRRSAAARRPWKHTNSKGETPLHLACMQGKLKLAEKLLRQGHPVNPRDYSGWLPIHEAANFGFPALVRLLVDHGALVSDAGGRHCGGVTPLHDAAGNGHVQAARVLLNAGADVAAKTDEGKTALELLARHRAAAADTESPDVTAELRQLEDEIKLKMQQAGVAVPSSPAAGLLDSPSQHAGRSPAVSVEQESESPAVTRPPLSPSDDDEDGDASAAYRRAIRGVGKSALSATPVTKRRRQRRSPAAGAGTRSSHVDQADYEWLEEDVVAPPARRRRRLSPDLAAAGAAADRRRCARDAPSPASASGAALTAVSPLRGSPERVEDAEPACSRRNSAASDDSSSREGSDSPVLGRNANAQWSADHRPTSEPVLSSTEDPWPMEDPFAAGADLSPLQTPQRSPAPRRGPEPDTPSPERSPAPRRGPEPDTPSPERSGGTDPVIEVPSSAEEAVTPARPTPGGRAQRRSKKRARQTRLTPLMMKPRSGGAVRPPRPSVPAVSPPSPSPDAPATKLRRTAQSSLLCRGEERARQSGGASAHRERTGGASDSSRAGGSARDGFSPTLRVFVEVGRDRLMIPLPAAEQQNCTVGWLARQAADRYYRQFLMRPHLELCTGAATGRPPVPLDPADAVRDVIRGPDDVIGSHVTGWERPPLTERYAASCAALRTRGVSAVAGRLGACQSSGRLDLSGLHMTCDRLRPLLRAVQRYSCVVHLDLSTNPLADDGVQELCAALPHLCGLETLDLTLVKMTTVGLSHLAAAVANSAALQTCRSLNLSYNSLADTSAMRHVAAILSGLPQLTHLDLTSCHLTDGHMTQHGNALASALKDSSLSELLVAHNDLSASALALLLRGPTAGRLRRLDVSYCGVRAAPLLSLLPPAAALQQLQLAACDVTDEAVTSLCSALSQLPGLSHLDLSDNPHLSGGGARRLLAALCQTSCQLSRLQLSATAGEPPAAADDEWAAVERLWREVWAGRALVETSVDGDRTLSVTQL